MYYAIIGDIIKSKSIKNRLETQEKLKFILNIINKDYKNDLAANFTITLGDEFQGLLRNSKLLLEIINKIEAYMRPLKIRFGVGIGNILTEIDKEISIGTDGPAWWYAREMINDLKEKSKGIKLLSNIKIFGKIDKKVLDLINYSLSLCYSIKNNWTKEQSLVTDYIIINYGLTDHFVQKEIAEKLRISPVSINKKLKLSLFYDLVYTQNTIGEILEKERRYL